MAEKDLIIEISDVSKAYRASKRMPGKTALENVSLNIPRGSFFGLLGPNGAGKSTLINILAGLTKKSSGSIMIDGINQDEDPRATRHRLGIVPQEVVLDPFFPVYETLEYYAGYYGIKKQDRKTEELLKALHLSDKRAVNSRRLSGGMKRRVLIAKALVHSPPILILDEPTAGVDVELREQLWDYVRHLNEQGTTILLTTHYLEEAEELCDEIAIINHGRIITHQDKTSLMQTMGLKTVIVSLEKPLDNVPECIAGFNPILTTPTTLTLHYDRNEHHFGEVLAHLQKAKIIIQDISTEEPDLEDIFRQLVNQEQAA